MNIYNNNFLLKLSLRNHHKSTGYMLRFLLLIVIGMHLSCTKLVEVDPPYTGFNAGNVYQNDASAISALTSIYAKMSSTGIIGSTPTSLSFIACLSADEFTLYSGSSNTTQIAYYKNALNSSITGTSDYWLIMYPIIYTANTAIEGIASSSTLTPVVKNQLLGEAYFMRAFCYHYLVSLYGDVPLVLTTDFSVSTIIGRTNKDSVWQQIISDLKNAESLMKDNFPDKVITGTSTERVRPTKWAATALLARVYLFTKDYTNAVAETNKILSNTSLFSLVNINQTFKKNNNEAIWQLQPVNTGWNTEDARTFIIPATGPSGSYPVSLSTNLINVFDSSDLRKTNWTKSVNIGAVTYVYPFKYQSATLNATVTEYNNVLRLAEQYLIRAEAQVQLGQIAAGVADLNLIRQRAGLLGYTGSLDKETLLQEILNENQREFFSEWGHRWFDLKRTGKVDAVMAIATIQKGGIWNTNGQYYPIPLTELQKMPGVLQNPGY